MGKDYILWDRALVWQNHQSSAEVSGAVRFRTGYGYGIKLSLLERKIYTLSHLRHMLQTILPTQLVLQVHIYLYLVRGGYYYFGERSTIHIMCLRERSVSVTVSNSCNYNHCQYQLLEFPFHTIYFCPPSSTKLSVTSSNKVGRTVMRLNY